MTESVSLAELDDRIELLYTMLEEVLHQLGEIKERQRQSINNPDWRINDS
jgi:hypothetical protein